MAFSIQPGQLHNYRDTTRKAQQKESLADLSIHVYEGRAVGRDHVGTLSATRVMMAKEVDPSWTE